MLAHSEKPFTLESFSVIVQTLNEWSSNKGDPKIKPPEKVLPDFWFTKVLIRALNRTEIGSLRKDYNLRENLRTTLEQALRPIIKRKYRIYTEKDIDGQNIVQSDNYDALSRVLGLAIQQYGFYCQNKKPPYTVIDPESKLTTTVLSYGNRKNPDIIAYTPIIDYKHSYPDRRKETTSHYLLSQMLFYIGLLLEKKLQEKAALLAYTCAEILYPQPNTLVSMGHMHLQDTGSDPTAKQKAEEINEILQTSSPATAVAMVFQGHLHLISGDRKQALKTYLKAFDKYPHIDRIPDLMINAENVSEEFAQMVSELSYPKKEQYEYIPTWFANSLIRYPDGRTPWTL